MENFEICIRAIIQNRKKIPMCFYTKRSHLVFNIIQEKIISQIMEVSISIFK